VKTAKNSSKSGKIKIPVCQPLLTGDEVRLVCECLRTNWISSKGAFIEKFEDDFARYCGTRYGISTTSGTTALHLALAALGVSKGDEVIVPSFTMIATAAAVCYTGATPVLVDCDPLTATMDPEQLKKKITRRTKAIIPVHLYGHPCDMDPIILLARKHGFFIVEDAAQAHGALYKNKKVGSLGDLACFSFYANKIITTGEGGMVVTDNKNLQRKLRLLKDHYFDKNRFFHENIGFNYRMTNVQAAIGLAQLKHIDRFVALRRRHAALYNKLLKRIDWLQPPIEKPYAKSVYWMYGVRIKKNAPGAKERLMRHLRSKGIDSRAFFVGMHRQPAFRKMGLFRNQCYPVSDLLSQTGLYLPSGSGLSDNEIKKVVSAVQSFNI